MQNTKLAIVIPCYNEADMLPTSLQKLWKLFDKLIDNKEISSDSFIFLVDDGSSDGTWEVIKKAYEESKSRVRAVRFSRNFGNQAAIIAGLENAHRLGVDAAITIDADLQQDIKFQNL